VLDGQLGVPARQRLRRIGQHDVVVGAASDAERLVTELDFGLERVVVINQQFRHVHPSLVKPDR
jgi:hypothetical protein